MPLVIAGYTRNGRLAAPSSSERSDIAGIQRLPARQYLPWVDCAKGIGICLVILGHLATGRWTRDLIYVFHMPLFFFLSGFLHRNDARFRAFAKKKAVHLLVPYASFVIATSLMKAPHFIKHGITLARVQHGLFVVTWGGEAMKGAYGVLWFLTCLFLTQQIANWLLVRFTTRIVATIATLGLLLSYVNCMLVPQFSLPLDANVVLASMPFFLAGYLLQRADFMGWRMVAIAATGAVTAVAILMRGAPLAYDMRDGMYGIALITPLVAFACILACLQLSQWMSRMAPARYIFTRIGAVSMAIMFLHKDLPGAPGYKHLEQAGLLITFLVTLLISYALAELITRNAVTRALLLGSRKDLDTLKRRLFPTHSIAAIATSGYVESRAQQQVS